MKRKRILALVLAMSMILGNALTVFADETITGEGDVSYVDTKVISVTLPTTATMKLIIDPQGLTALKDGETASAEDLASAAGLITGESKAVVTNLSSVPVKVSVKLTGTGAANFVADAASVEKAPAGDQKENNILLYALPSSVDVAGSADNYVASTTGITMNSSEASVDFVLDPAEYNFSKEGEKVTYELKEGETGHGTAIAFEGLVNTQADWSDFVKESEPSKIGMTAVFSYTAEVGDSVADTTEGAPYGMVKKTSGTITVEAKEVAPTFTASDTPGVINFTTGAGEIGMDKSVALSVWHQYNKGKFYNSASEITIGASTITWQADKLKDYAALGDSFTVEITYTNNKGEEVKTRVEVKTK